MTNNANMSFLKKPVVIYSVVIILFLIGMSPILSFNYFPTVDGPAHLYNARIIREMLFGDHAFYSTYYHFNKHLIPNWSGHLIAAGTGLFLPLWAIEKLLILLIVMGTPLTIILLLNSLKIKLSWHFLLLIPFTYTLPLYLGFFNFLIGIPIMFFATSLWIRWNKRKSFRHWIFVCSIITFLYFSHLMVFILSGILLGIYLIWTDRKNGFRNLFNKLNIQKISCFIPGLLLTVYYISQRSMDGYKGTTSKLSFDYLFNWLIEAGALAGLNGGIESPFSRVFAVLLALLFVFVTVSRILKKSGWQKADFLLIFSTLILILYFVVPDGVASGGFVSIRLLLVFLLLFSLWIITQELPFIVSLSSGMVAVWVAFSTLSYRLDVAKELDSHAKEMVRLSHSIKLGSVVLPLNYSNNWLHTNLSNYMGAERNILVLDNYEAKFTEFPIEWNSDKAPEEYAGNFAQSLNPIVSVEIYEQKANVKINYISRWFYSSAVKDSISYSTDFEIRKKFERRSTSSNGEIFSTKSH